MHFETLPEHVSIKIKEAVLRDMNPTQLTLHSKLSVAVIAGGLISLALCGQFGFGVTQWAEFMSHALHERMAPIPCAMICGSLYALFPTLILRLILCSPMQFRIILRKHFWSVLFWYFSVGITLAYHGEHGQGILELSSWVLSALLTSHALEMIARKFLNGWSVSGLVRVR